MIVWLNSVLEFVGGSASVSESGNFVLRSVVDEKEEAAKVSSSDGMGADGTSECFR